MMLFFHHYEIKFFNKTVNLRVSQKNKLKEKK